MLDPKQHRLLVNSVMSDTSLSDSNSRDLLRVLDDLRQDTASVRARVRVAIAALSSMNIDAGCGYTVSRVRDGVRLMDDTLTLGDALGLALALLRSAEENPS